MNGGIPDGAIESTHNSVALGSPSLPVRIAWCLRVHPMLLPSIAGAHGAIPAGMGNYVQADYTFNRIELQLTCHVPLTFMHACSTKLHPVQQPCRAQEAAPSSRQHSPCAAKAWGSGSAR